MSSRPGRPSAPGRRARNVYLPTGDVLSLSAASGWTPDPVDRLTLLGDGTWAGFLAGSGDGLRYLFWIDGDVATRLGYLHKLGVTAIQLLPIQEFGPVRPRKQFIERS